MTKKCPFFQKWCYFNVFLGSTLPKVPFFKRFQALPLNSRLHSVISKGIYVILFDIFNGCFLVQLNKLIVVKHLLLRKTDVLKTLILLERKFEDMHYLRRAKRYKVYLGKCLFWHYRLQLSFIYKTVSQISFNLFWSGDKRLLSEFLRKWDWFHGHNVSPNILAKN